MRLVLALGVALGVAAALPGCGYTLGYASRATYETVSVPVFENRTGGRRGTSRRELELALTRAVVREIQRRTPLRLTSRDRADVVLEGELLEVREAILVEDPDDQALLTRATVTVGVSLREGEQVRISRRLAEQVEFRAATGVTGTPREAFAPASEEAFRKLAERIVMLLER